MKLKSTGIMGILTAGMLVSGPLLAQSTPEPGSLAEAFLAQCQKMQACVMAEMSADGPVDDSLVNMIKSQMQGQCEAQLATISAYESTPMAAKVKACYSKISIMDCAVLSEDPEIPECEGLDT